MFISGLSAENRTRESYLKEACAASNDLKKAEENVTLSCEEYVSALAAFLLPAVSLNVPNSPYSVYNDPRLNFGNGYASAGATASLNRGHAAGLFRRGGRQPYRNGRHTIPGFQGRYGHDDASVVDAFCRHCGGGADRISGLALSRLSGLQA